MKSDMVPSWTSTRVKGKPVLRPSDGGLLCKTQLGQSRLKWGRRCTETGRKEPAPLKTPLSLYRKIHTALGSSEREHFV